MSKDTADFSNGPMPEETPATQTSLDLFNSFLNAPVTKLDADEYMANDVDGVTESLIGSGNMNFLMLQAGQTNESLSNSNPFDIADNGQPQTGSNNLFSPNAFIGAAGGNGGSGDTASDRAFDRPDDSRTFGDAGHGSNQSNTASSLSASNLAANTQSVTPFSDTSSFASSSALRDSSTQTATNGTNGTSGTSGHDGTSGTPGAPGAPGTPGEGGPITNIVNNIIDDSTHLGDTITNLIDNSIHNVGDILTTTINNAGDIITTTINNAGDIITTTINDVTNIFNNILDGEHHPIGLDLDATISDLTHLNLDVFGNGNVLNVINQTVDLSPVLDPVTGLIGNVLSDASLHVLLDPLHYDNSPTDSDLHIGSGLDVLGLNIPDLGIDVPLDPVETLLGDIDISLDVSQTLANLLPPVVGGGDTDLGLGTVLPGVDLTPLTDGLSAIINPVEDAVGDIDILAGLGIGLLGTDVDGTGAPDTDIHVPLDIQFIDNPLLNDGLNISLDPIEAITGDIDLDLTGSVNLLGDMAAPIIDNFAGGSNSILAPVGDVLTDTAGGLLPFGHNGDTDLSLGTGIDAIDHSAVNNGLDVAFDPIENLAGDIDIGGAIGLDLLGTNTSTGPDTDIHVPLDLGIIDNPLLQDGLDISLDPVEAITGDIDIDLGAAGNVFGNTAPDIIDGLSGGTGGHDLLSQAGDTLYGATDSLLPFNSGSSDSDLSLDTNLGLGDTHLLDNGTSLVLDPVESLTGDIDVGGNVGLGLLGSTSDDAGANDLNIGFDDLGLGNVGVNLDSLEAVTGDIDLGANISTDLTGQMSDPSAAINGLLGNLVDTLNTSIDTAVSLINNAPATAGGLDLGAITGTDTGTGGHVDIPSWTENVLPDPGGVLGTGMADTTSVIHDVISAPVAALPVAVIPVITAPLGGLLGGGSHHHGGLFG